MTEIARHLDVSCQAVSLALRGKAGVSDKLRQKIISFADQHGYIPNAAAAELMAKVRSHRQLPAYDTIAYINTFAHPELDQSVRSFREFQRGAADRAHDFGYNIEVFHYRGENMTPKRLQQILFARGTRGLLIGPKWKDEPEIQLDWNKFCAVLIGEEVFESKLLRVCNHHRHASMTALTQLLELGYSRIGLFLNRRDEESRSFTYELGLEAFRRRNPQAFAESCYIDDMSEQERRDFIIQKKLDGVLSQDPALLNTTRSVNEQRPKSKRIGYAKLDVDPNSDMAGFFMDPFYVGRVGFDMLKGLLHQGESGGTQYTTAVLIEGEWKDGSTAPRRRKQ